MFCECCSSRKDGFFLESHLRADVLMELRHVVQNAGQMMQKKPPIKLDENDTLEMNPEQVREILRRSLEDKRALRKTQQNANED